MHRLYTAFVLGCCAEALTHLDSTSTSGADLATDILCNRALTLLRQSPSEPEAALHDASAAIDCSKTNCKVNKVLIKLLSNACRQQTISCYTVSALPFMVAAFTLCVSK